MKISSGPRQHKLCIRCQKPLGLFASLTGADWCGSCVAPAPLPTAVEPDQTSIAITEVSLNRSRFRLLSKHILWISKKRPHYSLLILFTEMNIMLIISYIISGLLTLRQRTDITPAFSISTLALATLLAPLIETWLFQSFFFEMGHKLGLRFWPRILLMVIPFFLAHLAIATATGLSAGLVCGFFLSVTYSIFRERSLVSAYFATSLLHSANNCLILSVLYLNRIHHG